MAADPLRVVGAAILADRKLLLVTKRAAPDVFYLPGGKPEADEPPLATLERRPMEMEVYLAAVEGTSRRRRRSRSSPGSPRTGEARASSLPRSGTTSSPSSPPGA